MAIIAINGSSTVRPSSSFTHHRPLEILQKNSLASLRSPTWSLCFGLKLRSHKFRVRATPISETVAASGVGENLPSPLTSASDPPPIFDGTTRLYLSYTCPYAQRVWITRNCKGLQEKIKLVPLDLKDRPSWYKDRVYPPNKVPALEHNNEVIGESLDLMKYIDTQFQGPSLFPDDPVKRDFAEELLSGVGSFYKAVTSTLKGEADGAGVAFDQIETALSKFDDGPFFLGHFSLVDIAYVPFIERFQPALLDMRNYDITSTRPKFAAWIVEMNKIEGYNETRRNPKEHVENYKKRFAVFSHLQNPNMTAVARSFQ
ncbi:Glutathione S-transferase L2, chloroplastic [Linum perenne]